MNAIVRTREIRDFAITHGADLLGVADLNPLKGIFVHPLDLLQLHAHLPLRTNQSQ